MSICKALLLNLLSASMCLIGLFIGVAAGSNEEARKWLLAITAGMFIYIALVDMVSMSSQSLYIRNTFLVTVFEYTMYNKCKQKQVFIFTMVSDVILELLWLSKQRKFQCPPKICLSFLLSTYPLLIWQSYTKISFTYRSWWQNSSVECGKLGQWLGTCTYDPNIMGASPG